jgi:signal transduction protein with GAF and PtsI domain
MLLNQNLQVLEFAAGQGFRQSRLEYFQLRLGDGLSGVAALEGEIVYVSDLTQPEAALQFSERILGEAFVSAFIVPLIAKGQLRGVLELFYRRTVRNDLEWSEFLETLARQTAVAIDGIMLFDELQQSLWSKKLPKIQY